MIFRKMFLSVMALCALATAAIMPQAAGYLGFSQWVPNEATSLLTKTSVSGGYVKASTDLPLAGRTSIHVDSGAGVVYFGLPTTKFARSQPNYAAVGVPFLDVMSWQLVPDASSRLEFRSYKDNLLVNLLDYRISGFDATFRVSAQVVYDQLALSDGKGLVPVRVNWKVSKPGAGNYLVDDGAKVLLYDGANPFEVNLAALLNTAMGQSDLVLMHNGIPNPDFATGPMPMDDPLLVSAPSGLARFSLPSPVNCGESDQTHACGYGTKWQFPPSLWAWGEFSTVEIDYRANPGSGADKWKLWFFEENQAPAAQYVPKDLQPGATGQWAHLSIAASEYVTHASGVFDIDKIGSIPVAALKVVASWVEPTATLDISNVVLRRTQPPSLRFFGVTDQSGKSIPGKLIVRVLATEQKTPLVRLLQGATVVKSANASTAGEVIWTGIAPGDYTVVVGKDGFSYQPEAVSWNSTTSGNLVLVQQYLQKPVFSPNPPSAVVLDEGQETVISLGNLASDPRGVGYPLSWSVAGSTGDPIAFKLDPVLRTLRVGQNGSDASGTAILQLVATGTSGASTSVNLSVTVRPVNDPPKILASDWSVSAGSLLTVSLDSTRYGKAVWVEDPDDSHLSLAWSVKPALGAPAGTTATVLDRKLLFQAPAGFSGSVTVELAVQDPAGAQTTKEVTIHVVPPQVEIYGIKTEQLPTGDLKASFFSRYSLEPVALQNGAVKVLNPANGAWGIMPAQLTVLQPPSYRDGRWTDGQYELIVNRSSPWVRDGLKLSLASFAGGYTSLSVKLPLAADGKVLEKDASFTGLDLGGPVALVSASSVVGGNGEPQIQVSWNWIEPASARFIRLALTKGEDRHERIVPVPAGADRILIPWTEPQWDSFPMNPAHPYIRDGQDYQVEVVGADAKGNPGGGVAVVSVPSSQYELRITTTNLLQLPRPSGKICIQGTKGFRRCTDYDSYGGGQITTGIIREVPRDIYQVSVEDTRYQPEIVSVMPGSHRLGSVLFEHSPDYPVSRQSLDTAPDMKVFLLRRNFLAQDGASVEQELGTGDIVFQFERNQFPGGILDSVLLGVTLLDNGKMRDVDVHIPVTEYDEGTTRADLVSWTVRRSLASLKAGGGAALFTSAGVHSIRYLGAVARFANTQTPERVAKLRDSIVYQTSSSPVRWHVLDPNGPGNVDAPHRTISGNGNAVWNLQIPSTHGARASLKICRQNDNAPETCVDRAVKPEFEQLAFRPSVAGSVSVPGFFNFEEATSGDGMVVPPGKGMAASQWDIFATESGRYDLWIHWSTDHTFERFGVSLDSGATWAIETKLFREGWNSLGAVALNSGWNAVALRASAGATIRAMVLRKAGSEEPAVDISTLPISGMAVASVAAKSLVLDRYYKSTLTVRDAFGLVTEQKAGFLVQPDGRFGDLTLEQEQGSGDLLLKAGQTRFNPTDGAFRIRLAPRTPEIVPLLDSSDHLTIRIPKDRISPSIFGTAGLSKGGPLDSMQILTTSYSTYSWATRDCWDKGLLGGWGCETTWHTVPVSKPDSVPLQWTGFGEWKSGHDLRPLPKPVVSVVYAGLDSIQLKVSGLDDSSGQSRQTMSGKLTVRWTPGSHCASSSAVYLPFQQVFVADNNGTILFRPRLSSAAGSAVGGWSDTSADAPRLRHQWLDHSEGGGFYPMMVLPTPLAPAKRPWVSFAIRNPTLTPLQVQLWTLPGPYVGLSRQLFEYRLVPAGTMGNTNPSGVIWVQGSGSAAGWHAQGENLVLQPGDQELQIRMIEAGVTFRALGLRPSTVATNPTESVDSLPYVGTAGMNEVLVSAPSLASGTLHGFRIEAMDRMGNTSSDSVTVATQSSAAKFPTVGIALAPWDGSGWITGNVATASFVPDGRFTFPDNGVVKAWLRHRVGATGALNTDSTEVPVVKNQDGTYTATLTGLGAFGQTLQDFQNGDRTVLVAYVQSGVLRGNRSGIDFAVLSDAHPGALPATFLDGPSNKGLVFHVRQAWKQSGTNGNTYADLELPAFRVQEDDTATNRLLLRGALVSFTNDGSGDRLANVVGGRLAAVHCKLAGTVESGCHDVARMPWTLGRWAGFLETESMTTELQGSAWSLRVQQAELIDDAGRPSRNSDAFSIADAGLTGGQSPYLGKAVFAKDRFWFRNVVASGDEEAFGVEACQTRIRRTASGLEFETMGCASDVGPFLTFPLHIQTDGPWSVVGAAFDSLEKPYLLQWTPDANPGTKWVDASPVSRGTLQVPATNVAVTKSSLRNVSGASLWGYDVKSYSFGRGGVSNLVFDLVFPDSKLSPAQAGVAQRVKSFTGMSMVSTDTVMKGSPVLQGTGISTNSVQLYLGSSLRLDDVVKWTYARKEGVGWVLTPLAATNKTLVLSKAQDANWKYTKIDTITQAADRFRFPFTSIELGAGSYVAASSSRNVEISTGGATIQAKLNIDPNDDQLRIQVATPKVILDEFFTEKGSLDFKPVNVPDPELTLDPEFGLADIEGVGTLGTPEQTAKHEVWIAGLPVVNAIPSGRYQILANRGRLFVRLYRPQMALNDLGTGALPGAPSAEVQTAVFSTDRMPVAVGAELDVPASWRDWQVPGSIGSLQLDKVYLEATAKRDVDRGNFYPAIRLSSPTVVKLGAAFEKLGLDGYKLPIKGVTMDLGVKSGQMVPNLTVKDLDWTVGFETAPIGFALDLQLTRERIKTLLSGPYNKASDQTPVVVRLTTQGWPVYAKYADKHLDLSLRNWEIELTKDFPIEAMRNTAFHLDSLSVQTNGTSFDVKQFQASGTKSFPDGLAITSDVKLLGSPQNPVTVTLTGRTGQSPIFTLKASKIRIGNSDYEISCPDHPTEISVSLHGDFEGDICVQTKERISVYPLNDPDPNVWIAGGENGTIPYELRLQIKDGEFGITLRNAHLRTKEIKPVFPAGVDAIISAGVFVKDGSLRLKQGSAFLKLGDDNKGWVKVMKPFSVTVPDLRFFYNTTAQDAVVAVPDPNDSKNSIPTNFADGRNFLNKIAFVLKPKIDLDAGKCDANGNGIVEFSKDVSSADPVELDWGFHVDDFACDLAGMDVVVQGLQLGQKNNDLTVSTRTFQVAIGDASQWLGDKQDASKAEQYRSSPGYADKLRGKGVRIDGLRYDREVGFDAVRPVGLPDLDNLALEIPGIGVTVISKLDVMPLFDKDPGFAFDNVRLALPGALGGDTLSTNFSVLFNGNPSYVHVRGSMNELPLRIPGIKLTDDIGFDGARMVIRFNTRADGSEGWSFDGTAGLNLAGPIGKLNAELSVQKPDSTLCRVGVCKAVVSIRLKNGARIPLGTTGLYIAGLKGGFYDGDHQPACAKKCTGVDMPRGMKVELAVFLEAQSASILQGTTGVWVQLNRINFGIYGEFQMLEGTADADACAAVFGGGKQFHGEVNVRLHTTLSVQGGFIIDIWSDNSGNNMAAEASASVGLERGAIIRSRWFKFPRSTYWMGPFVTRFGKFESGSNGFTTGVRALGRTWGVGYVDGGFRLGNVASYRLARPNTSGSLFLAGSDYRVVPLGLNLKGGEVLSVNVGAAEGVDWRGAKLQLLMANKKGNALTGYSIDKANLTPVAGMEDPTVTHQEDSANIHSLIYLNKGLDQRMLVAIPKVAGTEPSGEEQPVSGANLASNTDDLQVFLGLVDPTVALTAQKCSADTTTVCVSGSVVNFRKDPVEYVRSISPEEQGLLATSDYTSQKVLLQKHHLKFWAIPVWDTTGGVGARDSAIPLEIPSSELTNLATCVTALPAGQTGVALNNCQWKPGRWKSGGYGLMAGVEGEDLLPTLAVPAQQSEMFLLDQTRRILSKPGESTPLSIAVSYPDPLAPITGLAVFGSALDSAQSGTSNQRRTIFARWVAGNHPEMQGHFVRWTDSRNAQHLFHAGTAGQWNWEIPLSDAYVTLESDLWDTTDTMGRVRGVQTAYQWMFEPPVKLEVAPGVLLRAPGKDSFYLSPRWDLAASWSGASVLGHAAGGTKNALSVAATPAVQTVELNQTKVDTLRLNVTEFDVGSTSTRVATDYAHLDLQLVGATGQPLSEAMQKAAPSVSAAQESWRFASNPLKIPLHFTARAAAQLCQARLMMKDSSWVNTDSAVCKVGDTLMPATAMGDYQVKIRIWNEGRLEAGKETVVMVPVKVTPPRPRIDRVSPDYLLGMRRQKIRLEASNLWVDAQARKPVVALRDGQGNWVRFVANGTSTRGTERELVPDANGRVDTTFEVELGNEYNVPGVDNRLELHVFHRDAGGVRWGNTRSIPFVENVEKIECKGDSVDRSNRHEIRAMDFVGFYPKTIGLRDTVTALFSEIHNPDYVTWTVGVKQEGVDSTAVPVVDVDAGRVRFVLPGWVHANEKVKLTLNIPDNSAGESCKDWNWHQTLTTSPAVGGSNVPRQLKASAQSGAPLVSFPNLLPDQRFEWVRGNPPQGWAWNWIQGMPTTTDVPQTDWLNLRLRRPEAGVQWQAKWLVVTPPREISLATTARTLRRRDTLPAGTNLAWSLAPVATRGRNGTSVPVMQCRWNDAVWETCAEQSLKVDLQRQGALELRLGWKLFLPVGDTMVWEPVQSWNLVVRPTNLDNVERVTLRLDGQRLAHLIDGPVTKTLLRVRRSGTELSRWDATAPVVRDASGQILPQQTEVWDPVAKRYEAWVEVADLAPHRSLTLELWLNDKSPVQAPAASDAWHGSSASAGTIGAAVAAAGQKQSVSLPASATRGWTSSLWLRWNPDAAETVWSSVPLEWGTRTNGSLWLRYRGDSVVSAPGVLDAQGPMLVGATWEVPSGRLSLWANGQRVASKMVAAQDERVVDPATVQVGGRYAVDELRWSQANTTSWKLRWESERPGSKLWEPWTSTAPVAPHVLESRGAVGDTLSLAPGAPVWADREAQVTSVPAAWAGATWLPGLAFRAKDTALQAAWIRAERFAQVCAVGDASWQPRTGWTRQSTDLSTSMGARAVWCHPLPSEVSGLPGPRDAQTASQTALSWFVLPTTGTTTPVMIQPGQNLDGWTLPATLPASLSGASLPNTAKSPDGTLVDSRRPGGFLVLVPLAQFLPSMGPVVDTLWVRKADGTSSQVLVVWTETAPKIDSIRVLVAPPRAVVPRDPSASWKIFASKDSVKMPDGTTPRWDMPAPVLGPRTCEERVFEANFRRQSELWLALPPGVRTQALLGWKSAGEVALGGQSWTQWTRSIEPGRFSWDATLVFGEGTCASFLLVAVERWRNLPDWTLPSVRLGAVGGSAVLQGGIHRIKNLEIQHAAALYLHSQQYSMKLLSATALGQKLVSSVLGLGVPQIKEQRDAETGLPEYVQVSSQFALHDLRADLLDADSVKVDLRNLRASGKARLTVTQYGATRFAGGIYAVLFRDRNGDMRYTAGADDLIGMEPVGSIGAGESVKIDFALDQHSRNFPEEVFMAWIDAGSVSPERMLGDHVALGGNPCREAKATRWLDASKTITRANGTVVVKAHLRDTDHDNLVRDRDSMDVLWYQAGKVCRAVSLDADSIWCVAAPSVGSNSDLSVIDLDADGVPEIVAGNTVLRRDGTVLWNAETFTGTTWSDFDADGLTDTLRGTSTCHTVIAGTGEALWSQGTGCASSGKYPKLAAILAHPERCADVSVSGIQVRAGSVWVWVANSGTTTLPAGIVLTRTNPDGTVERIRVVTTQILAAGAFEELEIGTDTNLTDRIQVLPGTLRDLGVWEFSTRNNRGNLSGELRP